MSATRPGIKVAIALILSVVVSNLILFKLILNLSIFNIKIIKDKNPQAYSGKPFEYSSNARDPKKRIVYQNVINQLNNNEAISKIAKENGITRQTVYAIKKRSLEAN